jgi:anti-sigma-K factor RskA
MSENDEDPGNSGKAVVGAEYVLGLLGPEGEARIRMALNRDPELRADVGEWQDRLARIADDLSPVEPPLHVWSAIRKTIASERRRPRVTAWDSARFWRGVSFASLSTAAAAAAIAVIVSISRPADMSVTQSRLVAALAAAEGRAAFVANYDPLRKQIVIVPANVTVQAGRVPELWLVTKDKRVISLGVVDSAGPMAVIIPPELIAETAPGSALVVTLEPPGGAPGGVATGPAIAKGELSPI